ncbi:MAG: transglutaminase family protein [Verrucomicrobiaceae bacterium]
MSDKLIPQAEIPGVEIQFSHKTTYRYSGPVAFGPHRLVLRPRESYHQRLEDILVTSSVASDIHWSEDIFGNMIADMTFMEDAAELCLESEFTVWRTPPPEQIHGPEGIMVKYPVYYPGIEESATYMYRRSVYPPQVEQVRHWFHSLNISAPPGEECPLFDRLAAAIRERIDYRRREEPGVQSPKKTLALASGSCRDTAVLMMETARSIGFAARFVSGYLESETSRVGNGATHAWTEIYLPDRGWTGFDPSIGEQVGMGHIAVGVSYHPRGVMPIAGSFNRKGNVFQGMTVEISSKRLES